MLYNSGLYCGFKDRVLTFRKENHSELSFKMRRKTFFYYDYYFDSCILHCILHLTLYLNDLDYNLNLYLYSGLVIFYRDRL